jgi:hypothetical protein
MARILAAGVFLLSIVATAAATWFVNEALSRPRLGAEVLKVELVPAESAGFPALAVAQMSDFIDGGDEAAKPVFAAMEKARANDSLTDRLELQAVIGKPIILPIKKIKDGLQTADQMLPRLSAAAQAIATVLQTHQASAQLRNSAVALFDKFDRDDELTQYMSLRPNESADDKATASAFFGALLESQQKLEASMERLRNGYRGLKAAVDKLSQGPPADYFQVDVLVTNSGPVSAGLASIALLDIGDKQHARLVGRTDRSRDSLIVAPKQFLGLSFRFDHAGFANADDWEKALGFFRTPATPCRVKVVALSGKPTESAEFPFFPSDEYLQTLVKILRGEK